MKNKRMPPTISSSPSRPFRRMPTSKTLSNRLVGLNLTTPLMGQTLRHGAGLAIPFVKVGYVCRVRHRGRGHAQLPGDECLFVLGAG